MPTKVPFISPKREILLRTSPSTAAKCPATPKNLPNSFSSLSISEPIPAKSRYTNGRKELSTTESSTKIIRLARSKRANWSRFGHRSELMRSSKEPKSRSNVSFRFRTLVVFHDRMIYLPEINLQKVFRNILNILYRYLCVYIYICYFSWYYSLSLLDLLVI